MRRLFAILLLSTFLIHSYGFYGIYWFLQLKLNSEWASKLGGENEEQIKYFQSAFPISLPYQPDQDSFQNTSGTFEMYGVYYRIIKQRYAKDTLYVVYTPDLTKGQLEKTLQSYLRAINGFATSGLELFSSLKTMIRDFIPTAKYNILPHIVDMVKTQFANNGLAYYIAYLIVPTPPPKNL